MKTNSANIIEVILGSTRDILEWKGENGKL